MVQIEVNTHLPTTPFPHYWEVCVGSCHAATGLREDWRRQLRQCHDELGFQYVRFHGLLCDDMSVYTVHPNFPRYSFFNVNSVFDFLVSIGMKPLIELGFMPADLASGALTCFHYKGNITPPKDYSEWGSLVQNLTRHLVERYGLDEVRSWFFEVWNEPNLSYFWSGSMDEYFKLYRYAAEAVKAVDTGLRVGGPATAKNEWLLELRQFCETNAVPIDFISTHHYPPDAAITVDNDVQVDIETLMARSPRDILVHWSAKARREAGLVLPLYYTEWNCSFTPRNPYQDAPYNAAFIIKTIQDLQGIVDVYSFWTFSDIFEETPFPSLPFHGGFGLLNLHGIPKPAYRAFELLHQMGSQQVPSNTTGSETVQAFATRTGDGVTLLASNFQVPRGAVQEESVTLLVKGWPPALQRVGRQGEVSAMLTRIDSQHGYARARWLEMGNPEYPNPKQIAELMEASRITPEPVAVAREGDDLVVTFNIPPQGVVQVKLTPEA